MNRASVLYLRLLICFDLETPSSRNDVLLYVCTSLFECNVQTMCYTTFSCFCLNLNSVFRLVEVQLWSPLDASRFSCPCISPLSCLRDIDPRRRQV